MLAANSNEITKLIIWRARIMALISSGEQGESGWSYGLQPEFYPGNPGSTPIRVNHTNKEAVSLVGL